MEGLLLKLKFELRIDELITEDASMCNALDMLPELDECKSW